MEAINMSGTTKRKCKICKADTGKTIVFKYSQIEISISTCSKHSNYIRNCYLDFFRKQISLIKSTFDINKAIKFHEIVKEKHNESKNSK